MILVKKILLAIICILTISPISAMIEKSYPNSSQDFNDIPQLFYCSKRVSHKMLNKNYLLKELWNLVKLTTTCPICKAPLKREFHNVVILRRDLTRTSDINGLQAILVAIKHQFPALYDQGIIEQALHAYINQSNHQAGVKGSLVQEQEIAIGIPVKAPPSPQKISL